MEPEMKMWQAVLNQALKDLTHPNKDIRGSAIEFILSDEAKIICDYADMHHESVVKQMWETL